MSSAPDGRGRRGLRVLTHACRRGPLWIGIANAKAGIVCACGICPYGSRRPRHLVQRAAAGLGKAACYRRAFGFPVTSTGGVADLRCTIPSPTAPAATFHTWRYGNSKPTRARGPLERLSIPVGMDSCPKRPISACLADFPYLQVWKLHASPSPAAPVTTFHDCGYGKIASCYRRAFGFPVTSCRLEASGSQAARDH